ncbi:UNVERIFIED_CONTAM: hypothetical protein FKN15_061595 [Acipenser sinensis]
MCKWRHSGCMARQGHFLGNYTVLDILRQEGYEVEHTPSGQPITDTIQLPNIRTTKGYITVEPPLTSQEQQRRTEAHNLHPPRWDPTSPSSPAPPVIPPKAAVVCLLAVLLPRLLQPS